MPRLLVAHWTLKSVGVACRAETSQSAGGWATKEVMLSCRAEAAPGWRPSGRAAGGEWCKRCLLNRGAAGI